MYATRVTPVFAIFPVIDCGLRGYYPVDDLRLPLRSSFTESTCDSKDQSAWSPSPWESAAGVCATLTHEDWLTFTASDILSSPLIASGFP